MIGHYFAMAFAKFQRTPFTTLANIVTLALGLACFIAAWGIATWWQSADTYHEKAGRTVIVGAAFKPISGEKTSLNARSPGGAVSFLRQDFPEFETIVRAVGASFKPISGEKTSLNARSPGGAVSFLRQDFPEFETIVRAVGAEDIAIATGGSKALLNYAAADPGFLDVFDFTYLAGSRSALAQPGSVVLTEDAARRLFGTAPALGKSIRISDSRDATVTAVIKAVRQPSFMGTGPDLELRFDMIESWASAPGAVAIEQRQFWMGNEVYTIGVLRKGATAGAINARLPGFVEKHMPEDARRNVLLELVAFPINELATRRLDNALFFRSNLGLTTVSVLLGLGILTLVVACINYASLATAQAAGRTKEFGMRRVMGAAGGSVMLQAWLEALLLTGAALALAIGLLALAMPVFRNVMGVDVLYFLTLGPKSWGIIGGIVLGVAFIAGAYPALILSNIRPADALRSGKSRSGPGFVARVLVGIQFASASFLLILVTVAQQQRLYLEEAALAPHADPIVAINDVRPVGLKFETVEAELKAIPGVKSVTMSDRLPWTTGASIMAFARSADAASKNTQAYLKQVGYNYFETLDLNIVAGRAFDRDHETRPTILMGDNGPEPIPMVIDQAYAENIGYQTPEAAIGQIVWIPDQVMRSFGRAAQAARIIGVAETDRMRMGSNIINGHVYWYTTGSPMARSYIPVVKISKDAVPQTMKAIETAWGRLAPNVALNTRFLNALFEQNYRQYAQVSQVFIGLALSSFLIASVGLLGIAVHVAVKRRHEVAVRKTLGSSAARVVGLLLTDFSKPVLVGNIIAWPVAWFAAQAYLSAFANRIELSATPFLLCMAITLGIAWLAVIGVVLRAATLRPAEVLRRA